MRATVDVDRRLLETSAEWDVRPLKRVSRVNRAALEDDTPADFEFSYIDISSVDSRGRIAASDPIEFGKAPSRARRIVARGDTLISTVRTYLKAVALIDDEHQDAIASTGFAVLSPIRGIDPRYLFRFVQSDEFVSLVHAASVGIGYPSIAPSTLGNLPVFVPPLPTQRAIASFLDRETEKIDALIEKKRRLLDLLEEKRTALITRAVTRGLDPDVPMKNSGVEWLGEIPEHWEVSRLRWLIASDNAGAVIDKSHWGDGPELLFSCQRTPFRSSFPEFPESRRTETGDLLLTRNGTPYVHLPPPGAIYTNVVQRIRLRRGVASRFVRHALTVAATSLRGFGDIIESFNMGTWKELVLPIPPKPEQKAIANDVENIVTHGDTLEHRLSHAISLLQEYRTSLISHAVTGKIDVRDRVPA